MTINCVAGCEIFRGTRFLVPIERKRFDADHNCLAIFESRIFDKLKHLYALLVVCLCVASHADAPINHYQ